jgi:5-methylcytosine-specific restriction endonuclease McrA
MIEFYTQLKKLGHNTYYEYLQSDHWKEFRKKYYRSRKRKSCTLCKSRNDIHLHHITYNRLGREQLNDVIPLCGECHELIHEHLTNKYQSKVEHTNSVIALLRAEQPIRGIPLHRSTNRRGRRARAIGIDPTEDQ